MTKETSQKNFLSEGLLVTYHSSKRKDITRINYYLFGRIATIKANNKIQKYYYPGVLENVPFKKITNGCYFIPNSAIGFKECEQLKLLTFIPATLLLDDSPMKTSHECWENRIEKDTLNWVKK